MRNIIFTVVLAGAFIVLAPQTSDGWWHAGIWIGDWHYCDCYWGEPSPWDPWWECPCYWEVWAWCSGRPYWMWPWWCRRYVEIYYSPCGRYYYVYYDYYLPGCRRVYVDGRYRYRYAVELERPYSITERIPRRSGLERPMPERVSQRLENLGPEYRVKTVAQHATPTPRMEPRIETGTRSVRNNEPNVVSPERQNIPSVKNQPGREIERPQINDPKESKGEKTPSSLRTKESTETPQSEKSRTEKKVEFRRKSDEQEPPAGKNEKSGSSLQKRTSDRTSGRSSSEGSQTQQPSKSSGSSSSTISRRR